jgi:hypothetical protein
MLGRYTQGPESLILKLIRDINRVLISGAFLGFIDCPCTQIIKLSFISSSVASANQKRAILLCMMGNFNSLSCACILGIQRNRKRG